MRITQAYASLLYAIFLTGGNRSKRRSHRICQAAQEFKLGCCLPHKMRRQNDISISAKGGGEHSLYYCGVRRSSPFAPDGAQIPRCCPKTICARPFTYDDQFNHILRETKIFSMTWRPDKAQSGVRQHMPSLAQ